MGRKLPKHSNSLDVARLAGVSQTTVSFVLNQRGGHSISAETRARVLKAADQLQYRSNRLSNGVFRGDTGLVGVVTPLITDDYYAYILSSISDHCAEKGKTVLFSPAQDHREATVRRDPLLPLIEYRVSGIVCVCQETIASDLSGWLDELIKKGINCVVVDDRKFEKSAHCVISDDLAGSRSVVAYLSSLGHTRIAHLSGGSDSSTGVDRLLGFKQEMVHLGHSESELIIHGGSYSADNGRSAARKIIGGQIRPTAIFAANDTLAAEVVKEMRFAGLRYPEDISVVGYGNTQIAKALDLTSVDQQPERIGLAAIESLLDQRDDNGGARSTTVIDCRLVLRGSTGPCSKMGG